MNNRTKGRRAPGRTMAAALMLAAAYATSASAADLEAANMVKAMSDYMARLPHLTIFYDSDIEVLTSDVQKIQFSSSGELRLTRPDRLRVSRIGGYADIEIVFDGALVTVHDKAGKKYAQAPLAGTVDEFVDRLRDYYGIEAPGMDLLSADPYAALTEDVFDGKYIGEGVVDGVECHHLAFRTSETDWQIWIETGERPFPRKYVITSKSVAAAPQYTLRIKRWATEPPASGTFTFVAPPGSKKVEVGEVGHIDEVPLGILRGDRK